MKLFRAISARIAMAFIASDRKDGDFVSLRRRLDSFLEKHGDDYPFMLAFDGLVLSSAERGEEGTRRFTQCWELLADDESFNARYVSLFCRFMLNLQDEQIRISAREEASRLKVDSWISWFLNFPPEEKLEDIIRERTEKSEMGKTRQSEASASFDF
ncbi:MAG: hypothetical protein AAGB23_06980 [Pseudomonadota bacterium]